MFIKVIWLFTLCSKSIMSDSRFGRLRDLLLARLSIVLSESVKMAYRRCVVVCSSCRTFSNAKFWWRPSHQFGRTRRRSAWLQYRRLEMTRTTECSSQGRSHQVRFGGGTKSARSAEKFFFCTSPPQFRHFGGPIMTYHCTGQKTFKTQRKQYIWAYRQTDILLLT